MANDAVCHAVCHAVCYAVCYAIRMAIRQSLDGTAGVLKLQTIEDREDAISILEVVMHYRSDQLADQRCSKAQTTSDSPILIKYQLSIIASIRYLDGLSAS